MVLTLIVYHTSLALVVIVVKEWTISCEITPNTFIVWSPPYTEENDARDIAAENSIVKRVGSIRERPDSGASLTYEERPLLSTELPV